jgi:uncharacterized membrane protein YfcA
VTPAPGLLAAVSAVTFAAAFVQGVTGFGSALVAMPLLALFLDVKAAAPLVTLLSLAINALLLVPARGRLPWRRVAPLLAGSALGVPAGVLFLAGADERAARAALGLALVLSSLALLRSRRLPIPPGWEPAFAVGGLAGLLGGAFNASGPPVMIHAASQPWEKSDAHAVLQLYFLVSNVGIVALHAASGLTTGAVALLAASALPALAAGSAAGWAVHRRVSEERFRRLVQLALLAAGAALLLAQARR